MKFKVEFTEKALNMLKLHIQYIALFNYEKAKIFKEEIFNASKKLESFPERYPLLIISDLPNIYRKTVINKKYLLIYEIIENKVYINYFLDCKQDYKWLL